MASASASASAFSSSASAAADRLILVAGSINADTFIDIDRLPLAGETLSTNRPDSGRVLPGGKGANQAVAVRKALGSDSDAAFSTHWIGRYGDDAHASMLRSILKEQGVHDDLAGVAEGVPSGQAFILLQKGGQNSIILVAGANHSWPAEAALSASIESSLRQAAVLMLQREIPQSVNECLAAAARSAGVPVMLDMGGEDTELSSALLQNLSFLTANETELARLAKRNTETEAQVIAAAKAVQQRAAAAAGGSSSSLHVLLTLGHRGSLLVLPDGSHLTQPAMPVEQVVDTTGAGDCFRGAFTVAYLEGKSMQACLKFASAAAALCIQSKGAMPSMPRREEIEKQLAQSKL